MKILHINDNYCNLGGAEKYLLDICKALEEMGNQIIIISSSEREHISVQGRREYFVKPSQGLRSGLRIWSTYRDIVKREKPDIIHLHNTHNAHYFISPLVIKRLCSLKPIVKFVHDARFFCPNYGMKAIPSSNEICNYPVGTRCLNRKGCHLFNLNGNGAFYNLYRYFLLSYELHVSRLLDRVIVGSQYMYDELVKNGFAKNRISIIPCYTEKALDIEITKNMQKGLILYIGRFDKVKGAPQFIEALNYLKDQQWCAEIVGDGELFKNLEERVEKLGLKNRIKFLGRLSNDEVDRCYQRCRMVVMPSMVPESFGLVGIEAMGFGKPVVAFDSGGISEWLIDGHNGFLVKRGDIEGLSKKISELLEDVGLCCNMGVKAKERVEKNYRKELHITRLLHLYEKVIKERTGEKVLA